MTTSSMPSHDKRFATCQARAALIGATLRRIENACGYDGFVLIRWALTRHLPDIESVEAWLNRADHKAQGTRA